MTTAEEALAQALRAIPVPESYEEWQERVDASYEADAAAILAALPEGAALVANWDEMTLHLQEVGALYERERLRADLAVIHGGHSPRGPVCSHCRVAHILLADPEDEA